MIRLKARVISGVLGVLVCCIGVAMWSVRKLRSQPVCVKYITQTSFVKNAVPTEVFEEILSLSQSVPYRTTSLLEVDNILNSCQCFKAFRTKFVNKDTLYIDYELKSPQLILGDLNNRVIDRSKDEFPLYPYYAPKRLPVVFLGSDHQDIKKQNAFDIVDILGSCVLMVDLSKMTNESLGSREIVVLTDNHLLRLSSSKYIDELARYKKIEEQISHRSSCIDLRIDRTAYISDCSLEEVKQSISSYW